MTRLKEQIKGTLIVEQPIDLSLEPVETDELNNVDCAHDLVASGIIQERQVVHMKRGMIIMREVTFFAKYMFSVIVFSVIAAILYALGIQKELSTTLAAVIVLPFVLSNRGLYRQNRSTQG